MKLRVMTYNIQHGRVHRAEPARIDLDLMADVIRECGADVVGLNEVRGAGESEDYTAQTEIIASRLGFHSYFGRSIYVDGYNPYGNAILSRWPILEARVVRIPDPVRDDHPYRESRTVSRAVIELPDGRRFAMLCSHFGLSPFEQEHAVTTASELLRAENLPYAMTGDFNMTPDDPLLAPINAVARSTDDLLAGGQTFPSHAPEKKIDYIYLSRDARVVSAGIVERMASDHFPVFADIEI